MVMERMTKCAQRSASAAAEMERLDRREGARLIPARKMAPIQRSAVRLVGLLGTARYLEWQMYSFVHLGAE